MLTKSSFNRRRMFITIRKLIFAKSFGGILLFLSAIIAMYLANSPYSKHYFELLNTPFITGFTEHIISMDTKTWVNDGLMTIFFLLAGLEIKRGILIGELSSIRLAAFPIIGAFGGMIVPSLIYIYFNPGDTILGFGIPMATDLAFALAVLILFRNKINISLKLFLVTLAVSDDIGAVLVISFFYASSINSTGLILAFITILLMVILNRQGVKDLLPYMVLGVLLWNWIHLSGMHTSITGIIIALTIPITASIKTKDFIRRMKLRLNYFEKIEESKYDKILSKKQIGILDVIGNTYDAVQSPLIRLEHNIIPITTFIVLPIFAFFNAGVTLSNVSMSLLHPVSLGIIFGLTIGKPLGIFTAVYLANYFKIAKKPESLSWIDIFGVSILGGIGFTMSIFIGSVAFENQELVELAKLSIIISSVISAVLGVIWLSIHIKKSNTNIITKNKEI